MSDVWGSVTFIWLWGTFLRHISNCEAVLVFGGWVTKTCVRLMRTFWWYFHYASCRKWKLTELELYEQIENLSDMVYLRNTNFYWIFVSSGGNSLLLILIKLETGDWVSFNSYGDILTFQTLYEKTFAESSFLSTLPLGILIPYQGKSFWELPPNRKDSIKIGGFPLWRQSELLFW